MPAFDEAAVSLAAMMRGGYGRRDGGSNRKKKRLDARGRVLRRGRILARLREGWAYDEVAREEELTPERVRQIVREALAQRIVDDETDHAKLQWHRLAPAMQIAGMAVADGERRSRRSSKCSIGSTATSGPPRSIRSMTTRRARGCSTRCVAANLGYDHARTAADGAPESGFEVAAGTRRRKKKCPGGSAQAFEKARFGEGNPRISLA